MLTLKDIQGSLLLLILAMGLGFMVNHLSPAGIALVGQWDVKAGVVTAIPKQDVVVQSIEINNPLRVREMIKTQDVFLVDVRPEDAYGQGHLPGAVSFPLYQFDHLQNGFQDQIKKDGAIIVYCSGFDCSDSHGFASRLADLGFINVRVYAGGYNEWEEMGFEIEKNEG